MAWSGHGMVWAWHGVAVGAWHAMPLQDVSHLLFKFVSEQLLEQCQLGQGFDCARN